MHFGIQLPGALADAGLEDVQAEFTSRLVHGAGPESPAYLNSLRERGAQLVAAGLLSQDDVSQGAAMVQDPTASWFSLGLVSAWGRRP